ncbi:MAG: hypothetical protein CMI02_09365 [Oceanospirillaceae bacterium]|nr:hypothetical protein [Oceanospirillaceae bacterium]MBT12231.1 hypothetical protein [Oceanospirillaceae bacterium]
MTRILIVMLTLLLAACLQNNSSSSSADAPGGGDSAGDGDSGSSDDGDDGSSGEGPGDGTDQEPGDGSDGSGEDDVACGWTPPAEFTPAVSLGNTGNRDTYDIAAFNERTDLNTDLTGTWVLIHNTHTRQDSAGERTRRWQETLNKFIFVIRDSGSGPEVASCQTPAFVSPGDTASPFSLPLFNSGNTAGSASDPQFMLASNSRMTGITLEDFDYQNGNQQVRFVSQNTVAVKVSPAVTALGSHTLNMTYGPEIISAANEEIWCLQQQMALSTTQACASDPQPTQMTLQLKTVSSQGVASFQRWQEGQGRLSVQFYRDAAARQYAVLQEDPASALSATFGSRSFSLNSQLANGRTYSNSDISATSDYSVTVP